MSLRLIFLILISGAGALWAPASAHQQKAAIIQILFNERSGSLEVAHRFYLHDGEEAVRQLYGPEADIIRSEDTRLKFALEVTREFSLWNSEDQPIELELLGYEMEGSFFWIYQEAVGELDHHMLAVKHEALRSIWPEQINTVNVEGKGPLQTLTFDGHEAVQFVSFPK